MERSGVCFGGFRLPARSRFGEGRPSEACGGAMPACRNALRRAGMGFISPWGSTSIFSEITLEALTPHLNFVSIFNIF